jgi:hypothetical protein
MYSWIYCWFSYIYILVVHVWRNVNNSIILKKNISYIINNIMATASVPFMSASVGSGSAPAATGVKQMAVTSKFVCKNVKNDATIPCTQGFYPTDKGGGYTTFIPTGLEPGEVDFASAVPIAKGLYKMPQFGKNDAGEFIQKPLDTIIADHEKAAKPVLATQYGMNSAWYKSTPTTNIIAGYQALILQKQVESIKYKYSQVQLKALSAAYNKAQKHAMDTAKSINAIDEAHAKKEAAYKEDIKNLKLQIASLQNPPSVKTAIAKPSTKMCEPLMMPLQQRINSLENLNKAHESTRATEGVLKAVAAQKVPTHTEPVNNYLTMSLIVSILIILFLTMKCFKVF